MTDVGCCRLAQALKYNANLQSLNLAYNHMTNESYLAFGHVLKPHRNNRTLTSLNLQVDRKQVELSGCQALLDMIQDNFVMESLVTSLGSSRGYDPQGQKAAFAYYIRMYLRLNHVGRQYLLMMDHGDSSKKNGPPTKADWMQALAQVQDSLNAIHYLITTNPSLCHRQEYS